MQMKLLWIPILAGYTYYTAQAVLAFTLRRRLLEKTGQGALAIAFVSQTIWLLVIGLQLDRCPLAGSRETLTFLAWSLVIAYVIARRWYKVEALRVILFPCILMLVVVASLVHPPAETHLGISQPVQRLLFPFHAGLTFLSFAAFFVSFGCGLMYMIQERELKLKRFGTLFKKLPSLNTCMKIGARAISTGVVLLAVGLAAGIAWSYSRDGIYLRGEAVEILPIAALLCYLLILQLKQYAGWSGRKIALASIFTFTLIVLSLVSLRFAGTLHGFN